MDQRVIRIDKGIPLPQDRRAYRKYQLGAMEPGDSFFVPHSKRYVIAAYTRVWSQRNGNTRKFTARAVTENGIPGVRVWRVS